MDLVGPMQEYGITAFPCMLAHLVQEVISNENARIRMDARMCTSLNGITNHPDIMIYVKAKVEVRNTSQDRLQTVVTEKKQKRG